MMEECECKTEYDKKTFFFHSYLLKYFFQVCVCVCVCVCCECVCVWCVCLPVRVYDCAFVLRLLLFLYRGGRTRALTLHVKLTQLILQTGCPSSKLKEYIEMLKTYKEGKK